MKRICAITTVESTLESFVIPTMRVFKKNGYDVSLICTMSDRFLKIYSEEFHCINVRMKRGIYIWDIFKKPLEFYKIFRSEKFDYVQYATKNASFYACIPAKICRIKTRVYCLWGLQYIGYAGFKRKIFKLIEKILCKTATHITVASWKNLEYAVNEGLIGNANASVIGDGGTIGVDLKEFDFNLRDNFKEDVLKEYPVLKGKTVFGFVGRIETDKGITELLKSFLELRNIDFALLIIGSFDELRSNLDLDILNTAKLSERIIFHGFSHEVPKYLSAIDILVHPTYREGFSMVIQQAMAMGCAVITTDVPGPSEVIDPGKSGILVPAKSVDQLVKAMEKLGRNSELRDSFSKAGLKRVREKFNRDRMLLLTYENRHQMMNEQQ